MLGVGPWAGKCPAPGKRKICKRHPRDWQGGQMRRRGGGMGAAWIDWCITHCEALFLIANTEK